jgi:two-component system, OmpR family, response regulator
VARILIVDDDPHIREVVEYALTNAGHTFTACAEGEAALRAAAQVTPELVVLDILMPGLDGIEVCRRLRVSSTVPVLFLSSKDDEIDRVIGLEVGGDDYMTKPFSPRELVARIKAMLRRVALVRAEVSAEAPRAVKTHGALRLDPERFEVSWNGHPVVLTVTEFGVVDALLSHPGKVYTRAELVDLAYAYDNHVTERTIDTHVRRVRKKFDAGGEPIETVFGLGYKLGSCRVG